MEKILAGMLFLASLCKAQNTDTTSRVSFFRYAYQLGNPLTVVTDPSVQCYNLPSVWQDAVSSVDPQWGCVVVFENENCHGLAAYMTPFSTCQYDLSYCQLDRRVRSFSTCRNYNSFSMVPLAVGSTAEQGAQQPSTFFQSTAATNVVNL